MHNYLAEPNAAPSAPFQPSGLMTTLRPVPEAEIRSYKPLYNGLAMSEFGGVSVLIIDPDSIPKGRDSALTTLGLQGFESFMMDFIPKEQHALIPQFNMYEGSLRDIFKEEEYLGFIPPCMMHGDGAALILAAGSGCTPERILRYSAGLERCDTVPLLEENNSWRYYALFHELAHAIGADEPQADHIAALFCRLAYPDSAAPRIEADMRALEAVLSATLLATGQAKDADYTYQTLVEYGWNMVVANDLANAVPAEIVAGSGDGDILAHRTRSYGDDMGALVGLGALIRDAGLDGKILSGRTDGVLDGARKLGRTIDKLTPDPQIREMAARFALAAGRIHHGAAAYVNPPVIPDGPSGSGVESGRGGKAGKPHPFTGASI